ncbi:MAG TPA: aldose 1-epimerase family protein [Jatrophihabitans sp.]|nr:aldose 1-epimerase family protein [Jatrophihabitans sp.]
MPFPHPEILSDREFRLSHDDQQALVHARGGALRSYQVAGRHLVDGWADREVPPAFNGAVLAPWPNRIRDGRWTSDSGPQQLAVNELERRTALHGLVMWADWTLVRHVEQEVQLECRLPSQPGYPFQLQLGVSWQLTEAGLRCTLSAENVGIGTAPFGVATHPFFGFEDRRVDELTLSLPAARYQAVDERLLPVELRPLAEPPGALRGVALDTAFTEVTPDPDGLRRARLASDLGEISVWADAAFGWWQVYTSDMFDRSDDRYRRSVAIEAMTCGPDAFNTGQDLIRLAPGERWAASWGVQASLA